MLDSVSAERESARAELLAANDALKAKAVEIEEHQGQLNDAVAREAELKSRASLLETEAMVHAFKMDSLQAELRSAQEAHQHSQSQLDIATTAANEATERLAVSSTKCQELESSLASALSTGMLSLVVLHRNRASCDLGFGSHVYYIRYS